MEEPGAPPPGDVPPPDAPPPADAPPAEETKAQKKEREKAEKEAKKAADVAAKEAAKQAKIDEQAAAKQKKIDEKTAKDAAKQAAKGGGEPAPPAADDGAPPPDEGAPPADAPPADAPPAAAPDAPPPADAGAAAPPAAEETKDQKKEREKAEKEAKKDADAASKDAEKAKKARKAQHDKDMKAHEKDMKAHEKKAKAAEKKGEPAPPAPEPPAPYMPGGAQAGGAPGPPPPGDAAPGPPPPMDEEPAPPGPPQPGDDGLGAPPDMAQQYPGDSGGGGGYGMEQHPADHPGGYEDQTGQWIADGGGYEDDHGQWVGNPEGPEGYYQDEQWVATPTQTAPASYHQQMQAPSEAPPSEAPPPGNAAMPGSVLAAFGGPAASPAIGAMAAFAGGAPAAPVVDETAHFDLNAGHGGGGEEIEFTEPGPIGMALVKRGSKADGQDYMVIDRITPGKQADSKPELRPGLILKSVGGQSVEHLSVADVSQLLQQRPVKASFVYRTADVSEKANDFLDGNARQGAMGLGMASKLHSKLAHAHETVDTNHGMLDHTAQDETFEVSLTEQGPLGFRLGDHNIGTGVTYLVVTSIKEGSQAARLAPQVTPGLVLKAVNGQDVVNWPTIDVMAMMAHKPINLTFLRLADASHPGGGADPQVVAKLQMELAKVKAHLTDVEADGAKMLEYMYHKEDELESLKSDNHRMFEEAQGMREQLIQLDQGQADLMRQLHAKEADLQDLGQRNEVSEHENTELRKRLALLADHFETTKKQLGEQVQRVSASLDGETERHAHTTERYQYTQGQLDRAIAEHGQAIASEKFHRNQYELASKLRATKSSQQSMRMGASMAAGSSVGGTPRSMAAGGTPRAYGTVPARTPRSQYGAGGGGGSQTVSY